ncbi:response regulator [Cronbergia sp. UHCC 0137]|uniref:response regulator n=1 Tax=Cronbergia sp. UHCC 0137 TaxID=3110239 RepID=UPI002B219385|nr:response regulator [Cronbergia sp. UHCC 0137]MEA5619733.1 response regulator [Cronbergia sp. UHCC 0137]
MKTFPINRYRFFQRLQPLQLLTKITRESATGCLQLFSTSGTWSIYIDEGKLIYACYAEQMFEPLYRKLQQLSQHISTLPIGINDQLRTIFETNTQKQSIPNPDYLAICWLVSQRYISHFQAAVLIEQLALEVLESFLKLELGSYEFIPENFLDELPKFCYLDLNLLIEQCQNKSRNSSEERQFWRDNQPTNTEQKFHRRNRYQSTEDSDIYGTSAMEKKQYKLFSIVDNFILLENIQGFLDEEIFSVTGFTDVSEALMEIIHLKADLIFLDVLLPNLNAYQVCSLLRKNVYFRDTPIILMAEKPSFIDRAKAKLVGASGYLYKPFNQDDLLKTIFQHLA